MKSSGKTMVMSTRGKGRCTVKECTDPYYARGFCKRHHQWRWKRGLLPKPQELSLKEKFKLYTTHDSKTGCWLWNKGLSTAGYGRIWVPGAAKRAAHRVAYELFVGTIPDGLSVCHRCDRPACCNPEHLFVGTHQENMRDSWDKGRGYRIPPRYGEAHHNYKGGRKSP